jgi:signal transduction histidine kinase
MQNAGKHAGEGARINVSVEECDGRLCFEVADSGSGFDATGPSVRGHGFINMADRVGAIGGTIAVESSPGKGTKVRGEIPLS